MKNILALLTLLACLPTVFAADQVVTTNANSGAGSLRQAITDVGAGETITFDAALDGATITVSSALSVSKVLTIDASTLMNGITVSGGGTTRVFNINGSANVTFDSLVITGGTSSQGGGVSVWGTVKFKSCTLTGNHSTEFGGGYYSAGGSVTFENSTISGNTAVNAAAGFGSGTHLFVNTTISGNTASGNYGGIASNGGGGNFTFRNSTISGNVAGGNYGGLYAGGSLSLENCILAGNTATTYPDGRIPGSLIRIGVNLIGNNSGMSGFPAGPFVGTSASPLDPQLAPLGNYGGRTQTMPPLAGSLAIDGAVATANLLATDQRGFARIIDGDRSGVATVDIGAVENLTGADLSGIDFAGLSLANNDLTGTLLANANLTSNDFTGVTLTGVSSGGIIGTPSGIPSPWLLINGYLIGPEADLKNADLDTLDLSGATLTGVQSGGITGTPSALPVDWALVGGFLVGPGTNLDGADLTGANLAGVDLSGVSLTGADLTGADLSGANLSNTGITLPQLSTVASTAGVILGAVDYSGADLSGVNLATADLTGANLTNAFAVVDTATDEADVPASGGTGISLREALRDAPAGIEVRFDAAVDNSTLTLTSGQLTLTRNVDINGSALTEGISISGNNASRVFVINAGVEANLSALTIRDGKAPNGGNGGNGSNAADNGFLSGNSATAGSAGGAGQSGGGIYNNGMLTLTRCTIISNTAGRGGNGGNGGSGSYDYTSGARGGRGGHGGLGGGIYNVGTLDLSACTLSSNTAGAGWTGGGGGYYYYGGRNTGGNGGNAGTGGGIYNVGTMISTSCTVAGNTMGNRGNPGNSASYGAGGSGGGIFNGGSATLNNNLIAQNNLTTEGSNQDVSGTVVSLGYNLIGIIGTSTGWAAPSGDLLGTTGAPIDSLLGPLSDNGGLTHTMALLHGSPAVKAGDPALVGTDQRGESRPSRGQVDIGAYEVTFFPVEIAVEQPVENGLDDGISLVDFSYAALGYPVTRTFTLRNLGDPDLSGISISVDGTNSSDVAIISPASTLAGVSSVTFSVSFTPTTAGPLTAALHIASNDADENPFDISLTGYGIATGVGFDFENANLFGANLTGLDLTGATSGGITGIPAVLPAEWSLMGGYLFGPGANLTNADLTGLDLTGTNLEGADLTGATLSGVISSGITGNPAHLPTGWGLVGGYLIGPGADLTNVDLTGLDLSGINLTGANLDGADLTGVTLSGVISGSITGSPANLPADWALIGGYLMGPGVDLTNIDLTGLDLTGINLTGAHLDGVDLTGVTLTGATLTGVASGSITGTPSALPTDWNLIGGYLMGPGADLTDADLTGLDLSSANLTGADLTGAFIRVSTTVDELDVPASAGTGISLREAVRDAPAGITVLFDNALDGDVITLTNSYLLVTRDLFIDASNLPSGLSISGGGLSRILFVGVSATVELTSLTLRDGIASNYGGSGGAIYNSGNLTLTACTLSDNSGRDGFPGENGGHGGAIYNSGTLNLNTCTLAGNQAGQGGNGFDLGPFGGSQPNGDGGSGGAIYNFGGTLSLTACTLSSNTARAAGSGGYNTVVAGKGGGIYSLNGTGSIQNTLIAENTAALSGSGPDVFGAITSQGHNLIGISDASSGWDVPNGDLLGSDVTPMDPVLGPLADNGGPTATMALLVGSPAMNAGDPALTGTDQRGQPRLALGQVDIGAFEVASLIPAEITVESPLETRLVNGSAVIDFGNMVLGTGASRSITIRNLIGYEDLTGIAVTIDGSNTNGLTLTNLPPAILTGGASATLAVRFAPVVNGYIDATVHIASSDSGNDPFDIVLTGLGYRLGDTDGDGLTDLDELSIYFTDPDLADSDSDGAEDGTEINLASLGFVNGTNDSVLVNLLKSNSTGLGLYDESNVQDLALGQPLIGVDTGTGKVTLKFKIHQSPDLSTPWTPVPSIIPTFNFSTEEIEAEFDAPAGNAYFFRLYSE